MKLNPKQFTSGSFSGSFSGDGSQLINVPGGGGGGTGSIGPSGSAGRGVVSASIIGTDLSFAYTDNTTQSVGRVVGSEGPSGSIGPSGSAGRGVASASIVSNNLIFNYTDNTTASLGRVVGSDGASGNGITSITQPTSASFRINTRDLAPVDITIPAGPSGSIGPSGSAGPNSLSFLINQTSYIDHMFPGNTNNTTDTHSFTTRVGGGITSFKNNSTIGLGGQVSLNTTTNTVTEAVIRKNGLSGFQTLSQTREYHTGIWFESLYNATNGGNFIFSIQNEFTPTILSQGNRTGIYVLISWNNAVSANTFSLQNFNNTVSSTIVDTTPVNINTLYAIKVLSNLSSTQLWVNGNLLLQLTTNIPTFARIQPGVGITKSSGSSPVVCNVDYIATFLQEPTNTYVI